MTWERIEITKELVDEIEEKVLFQRHIERYCLARKYAFGNVLDVASGVGYGSYLCSKNPDIISITGFDIDHDTVLHANDHFSSNKIKFHCSKIKNISGDFDFLLSLETIEHLENPKEIADLATKCKVKEALISFPNKKTTHYNHHHRWDITSQDIEILFDDFYVLDNFDFYDSKFIHLAKKDVKTKYKEVKLFNKSRFDR